MSIEDESTLRLSWRRTWADREDDFVANSPIPFVIVGRIMLIVGGPKNGEWQWTYQASIKGLPWETLDRSGFCATDREAAKAVEDTWFAALDGKRLADDGNRYIDE